MVNYYYINHNYITCKPPLYNEIMKKSFFLQILTNIDCSENLVSDVGVEDVSSGLDDAHDQDLERVQLAEHRSQ
jgi:hypothetical protein